MLTACAGNGEMRAIPLTPLPSATPFAHRGTSGNVRYNFGEAGIFLLEAVPFTQSAAVKTDVGGSSRGCGDGGDCPGSLAG